MGDTTQSMLKWPLPRLDVDMTFDQMKQHLRSVEEKSSALRELRADLDVNLYENEKYESALRWRIHEIEKSRGR